MKNSVFSSTNAMIMTSLGVVINLVLGTVVQTLNIPFVFLDTIGTIFVASIFGPLAGAVAGGLSNVIQGMITNPITIPFAFVNIMVGLVVGFIAKRWKFDIKTAVITGLILSVVAPLIGTPIAVWLFDGLTGNGTDFLFIWLVNSGQKIFQAAFIQRITENLIDKIASCILVSLIITKLPKDVLKGQLTKNA
ncbi:energy-coupling factor transport system substrate-specific component [Anaerosolibacter carboniphilus]|uniref:Energy-coupling factor transport system substrate-specific component n=1 Tax=Anaerosolibacter carboniphilus TaxID=1417629 RepID=A0A841L6L7_9FIRM|nr:CD3073 family putative ECF transporter S component [Anaerosolibacter carboniphilus]MBB6218029.1 energy-coupling factor transport system substrate-specific component [Anaerosolibacter carboniphilus]